MGDKPWQQPHVQASYQHTAGTIQASSSSIHGSFIRKDDPAGPGYADMAEFDQALFFYLNGQGQTSVTQEQQPQTTLNIFPSQPMHVVKHAPNKGSMGTKNTASNSGAGPSKTPAGPKDGKPVAVKREGSCGGSASSASSDQQEGPRTPDAKTLRRLAQNREAARKSRLRKKAYIQNLETSRIRLSQMEQELQRSRTQETSRIRLSQMEQELQRSRTQIGQGVMLGGGALSGGGIGGLSPEAAWFDEQHGRWLEEHGKVMRHLRAALEEADHAHADGQLRQMVDAAAAHHDVLAELKAAVARADAFHLISGTWVSAAERCFLWIGGFRPSDFIKVVVRHAEPLTEQQAVAICSAQQWARDAEAALDSELQAMHRSVSDAVSSPDAAALLSPYADVPGYMAAMSLAIGKLASLEAFVRQADAVRLQTLHQLPQILTARQAARCFLAIADYSHRLRTLSELWLTRPLQEPATNPAAGRFQP